MRLVSLILLACLCVAAPAQAGPLANIRAKIKAVLHHEPTPAAGVTTDKPEAAKPMTSRIVKRRRATAPAVVPIDCDQKAPTAPAEVEPPKKTAAKSTAFSLPGVRQFDSVFKRPESVLQDSLDIGSRKVDEDLSLSERVGIFHSVSRRVNPSVATAALIVDHANHPQCEACESRRIIASREKPCQCKSGGVCRCEPGHCKCK